jgi:pimeloyl-ACP methyl ester carboxylesterase
MPPLTAQQSIALDATDASFRAAMQAEQANSPACVDYYYQSVAQTWPYLGRQIGAVDRARAWNLYHTALAKLVETGQRFYRLEPEHGLKVNTPAGAGFVAIEYAGFPWHPGDFNLLEPATRGNDRKLVRTFVRDGLGVPLLAVRQRQKERGFIPRRAAFAATAILHPGASAASGNGVVRTAYRSADSSIPTIATLRLVDPVRVDQIAIDGQSVPIARDLSSAVSSSLSQTQESPVDRLLRPGTPSDYDGLQMLEPYQPGKIPIIFVHGLIADRSTWSNMTNELRAVRWVTARYQFWYFQYPTGEPFLRSALTLREQTRAAVQQFDPHSQDPALSRMVLIGHSLGGLISKLQVSYSSTTIWDGFANRPFPTIQGQPQYLDQVWRLFFFEPQPLVRRVVFIGTPHRGAATASRVAGRFASGLVQQPADRQQMHRRLVAANPGVFSPEFQRRIPTSVDLLEPDSRLLSTMARLTVAADVRIHSIVGIRQGRLGAPSDGVVPVTSARHPGASSESFINARHGQLTQHPETLAEVSRILAEHLHEVAPH